MRMKIFLAAFVCATTLAAALPLHAAQIAQVGKSAPEFAFTGLDGNRLTSKQFSGHPVFLNFFATWCPPCKLELPNIVKSYPTYKARVVYVGVDQQESPALVKPFLKQYSIAYLVGIDEGSVADAFGVAALPQSVFIDRNGVVRAIWRGYMPPNVFATDMALITH
jgi:cytochrome c biogenesis protein CcmG, thiol:disulfide interchange protein DsbE